jgi:hypothetical protein
LFFVFPIFLHANGVLCHAHENAPRQLTAFQLAHEILMNITAALASAAQKAAKLQLHISIFLSNVPEIVSQHSAAEMIAEATASGGTLFFREISIVHTHTKNTPVKKN